jgi:hypothetical protein
MHAGMVGLTLLKRALEEVFGAGAINAQFRDISGFTDVPLNLLVEQSYGPPARREEGAYLNRYVTRRATWPPAHFQRNPPGRGQLGSVLRSSRKANGL